MIGARSKSSSANDDTIARAAQAPQPVDSHAPARDSWPPSLESPFLLVSSAFDCPFSLCPRQLTLKPTMSTRKRKQEVDEEEELQALPEDDSEEE